MAAHAVSIDQFHHARLTRRLLVHLVGAEKQRIAIDVPAEWRMRNSEIEKDVFVKPILPHQQFMQASETRARLSPLNDPVVVSAANCDGLTDAKLRQNRRMD